MAGISISVTTLVARTHEDESWVTSDVNSPTSDLVTFAFIYYILNVNWTNSTMSFFVSECELLINNNEIYSDVFLTTKSISCFSSSFAWNVLFCIIKVTYNNIMLLHFFLIIYTIYFIYIKRRIFTS